MSVVDLVLQNLHFHKKFFLYLSYLQKKIDTSFEKLIFDVRAEPTTNVIILDTIGTLNTIPC